MRIRASLRACPYLIVLSAVVIGGAAHGQEASSHLIDADTTDPNRPKLLTGQITNEDFAGFFPSREHPAFTLRAAFEVGLDGRATNCAASQGDDWPALYRHVCDMIVKRLRFSPAKDSSGGPVVSTEQVVFNFSRRPRASTRYIPRPQ